MNRLEDKFITTEASSLPQNVTHGEKMDPIDFQGQGSNVKVTMDLTLKNLENRIEDKAIIKEAITRGCYICLALFKLSAIIISFSTHFELEILSLNLIRLFKY